MNHTLTLDDLNRLPDAQFIERLGTIFEHSPWVAARVVPERPFKSVAALHQAMVYCVASADRAAQLALIRAHPELAGRLAADGALTAVSAREQAGAGLDQCTAQELAALSELNRRYMQKFGFPFVLAVRGYDRAGIIAQFQRRLALDAEQEHIESLQQIYRIARYRLDELVPG